MKKQITSFNHSITNSSDHHVSGNHALIDINGNIQPRYRHCIYITSRKGIVVLESTNTSFHNNYYAGWYDVIPFRKDISLVFTNIRVLNKPYLYKIYNE